MNIISVLIITLTMRFILPLFWDLELFDIP
jgi:hypothetical protein